MATCCNVDPIEPAGRRRLALERQPCLRRRPSPLAGIAAPTRCNDILPLMLAALDLRHDMIDVLRVPATVLAYMLIPEEDRPSRDGNRSSMRNRDVALESDDGRYGESLDLGMPCPLRIGNHHGALTEQEHKSPSGRHDRERLVRGVEYQSPHRLEIVPLLPGTANSPKCKTGRGEAPNDSNGVNGAVAKPATTLRGD